MELKTIFSNVEPSNKNVIWLTVINGVIIQKIYTANGWQIVGSPSVSTGDSTSLEESTDKYIFRISDSPEDLDLNIDTAADSTYISPNSLYGEYVNNGGARTKEEFNESLFNLIG